MRGDARDSLLLRYIDQTDFVDAKDLITRLKATIVLRGTARNDSFDIDSLKLLRFTLKRRRCQLETHPSYPVSHLCSHNTQTEAISLLIQRDRFHAVVAFVSLRVTIVDLNTSSFMLRTSESSFHYRLYLHEFSPHAQAVRIGE